jgi:hypothetical protein
LGVLRGTCETVSIMLSSGDFWTEAAILLDFAYKTFRRRTSELAAAASKDIDKASKGVLLFYAAECGLKAVYMSRNSLRLASDKNAAATKAASDFGHRLDHLIRELKISPDKLPHTPGNITMKDGQKLSVHQVHEAWRYGGAISEHEDVLAWLGRAVKYVMEELK